MANNKKKNYRGNKYGRSNNSKSYSGSKNTKDESVFSGEDTSSETLKSTPQGNAPEWHMNNPEMVAYSTLINVGYPLGHFNSLKNENFTCDTYIKGVSQLPGIMSMTLLSGPGITNGVISYSTRIMNEIYTTMRTWKRGINSYSRCDLFLHLLQMLEVTILTKWAQRAYGMINYRSNTHMNLYEYKAIIIESGWDFDDLVKNQQILFNYMNQFAIAMRRWVLPADMPIFKRARNIYSNYYCDNDSESAQLYVFKPSGYRYFDATHEKGGALIYQSFGDTPMTVERWKDIMDDLMNRLNNDDLAVINGDIVYVYKDKSIPVVEAYPQNYCVSRAVYDPMMLVQIQNATVLYEPDPETCSITQEPSLGADYLVYSPEFDVPDWAGGCCDAHILLGNRIYNIPGSPEMARKADVIMEATRLMNIPVPADEEGKRVKLVSSGSDVVVKAKIVTFNGRNLDTWHEDYIRYEYVVDSYDATSFISTMHDVLHKVALVSKFKAHPPIHAAITDRGQCSDIFNFDDIDTYGIITRPMLDDLHNTSIISLWHAPDLMISSYKG
jgi:hypothetical protein